MKYIKKLRLVNFQSHADTCLELDQGLNILVGESDQGKTAVIRALRWLLYNEPRGTAFIRVGENYCEVTATLNDGTMVKRIRDEGKRSNRYEISYPGEETQVFERFKNEVPLEVQRELEVYKLWVDRDQSLEVNIARQLEAPFLVEDTASNRARVIGRIANLHIIDAAQRGVARDIRNMGKTKNDLDDEIANLEQKREEYADLPDKEQQLLRLRKIISNCDTINSQIKQMEELEARIKDVVQEIKVNEKVINGLKQLDMAAELYQNCLLQSVRFNQLRQVKDRLVTKSTELKDVEVRISRLQGLEKAEKITAQVSAARQMVKTLEDIYARYKDRLLRLEDLEILLRQTEGINRGGHMVEKLKDMRQQGFRLQELRKTSKQLHNAILVKEKELSRVERIAQLIGDVGRVEKLSQKAAIMLDQYNQSLELEQQYQKTLRQHQRLLHQVEQAKEHVEELSGEYIKALTDAGRCPVCNSKITPDVIEQISSSIKL